MNGGKTFRFPCSVKWQQIADTFDALEFYAFWPLRQVGYRVPGLEERHVRKGTFAATAANPQPDE